MIIVIVLKLQFFYVFIMPQYIISTLEDAILIIIKMITTVYLLNNMRPYC